MLWHSDHGLKMVRHQSHTRDGLLAGTLRKETALYLFAVSSRGKTGGASKLHRMNRLAGSVKGQHEMHQTMTLWSHEKEHSKPPRALATVALQTRLMMIQEHAAAGQGKVCRSEDADSSGGKDSQVSDWDCSCGGCCPGYWPDQTGLQSDLPPCWTCCPC